MKSLPLNCLILEDEELAQTHILSLINESTYLNHVETFDNVKAARAFLKENNTIDVIFLDLQLSGNLTGVDLLEIFEEKTNIPSIIICSGIRELMIESLEYNKMITGYLKKPFGKEKFDKFMEENLEQLRTIKNFNKTSFTDDNLPVKAYDFWRTVDSRNGAIDVRINHDDIGYISASGNYATFVLLNKKPISVQTSLKKIEEILPKNVHYRISKDCILCNPDCIKKYIRNDRELMLQDETRVSVGDIYHRGLRAYIDAY